MDTSLMRRRWVALGLAAALVVGGCSGDDEGDGGSAGSDEPAAAGSLSLEDLDAEPCALVTTEEAERVIGDGAEKSTAAPETVAVCTYTVEGASLAVQVTQITEGTTIDDLGTFEDVPGVGDEAGWEVAEVGDAGRLVAIDGGALLSVNVTRPGQDDTERRIATTTLARTLLERLADVEPLPAPDATTTTAAPAEECALIDPEVLAAAVGLELELGPEQEGSCTFTSGASGLTVGPILEGVTERDLELGLANAGNGEVDLGIEVTEVDDLGDRAVLVTRVIGGDLEFGQMSVLVGDTLYLASADRVADAEAVTRAAAQALIDA